MKDSTFVNRLNEGLKSIEDELSSDFEEVMPNIFIIGLPRSGTTLLAQVLFNNLDIACTNNLMAKFWDTPFTGARLSKMVISGKSNNYKSNYGKTENIMEPHEYSWFWQSRFAIKDFENYDIEAAHKKINWKKVKMDLLGISNILEAPVVHKPLEIITYHLEHFYALFSKAIFIYIKRDLEDVAISLTQARLDYYGDVNLWWGSYPEKKYYNRIKSLSYDQQIAGQVFYLNQLYTKKLAGISDNRLIEISYQELCESPHSLLEKVRLMSIESGYEIMQTGTPNSFVPVFEKNDKKYFQNVLTELHKLQQYHE